MQPQGSVQYLLSERPGRMAILRLSRWRLGVINPDAREIAASPEQLTRPRRGPHPC